MEDKIFKKEIETIKNCKSINQVLTKVMEWVYNQLSILDTEKFFEILSSF